MTDFALLVKGRRYRGWTSATVTRAIENVAGTFQCTLSERSPGEDAPRSVRPGDACEVLLEGERQLRGYVDTVRVSYDARSHTIDIGGRDATGDLVDCSAASQPGEWSDALPLAIAQAIAEPFGVEVSEQSPGEAFRKFRIQEGETAFEAIERLSRMRGVLPLADGNGGIELGRPTRGRAAASLVHGVNILSATGEQSWVDRHSEYTVKGQQRGSNYFGPEVAAHVKATALDPGVTRYRPLTVIAEQGLNEAEAEDRVRFEASVRAARSRQVTVTVQGWRQGAGDGAPLWAPGLLVPVRDGWLGLARDLLIAAVEFSVGDGGTTTRLTLMPQDAFQMQIEAEEAEERGSGWWG